jgi:hypothetical protein
MAIENDSITKTLKRWLPTAVACLLTGCGSGQMDVTYVSGKVTYQDQPLTAAVIHFVPESGPAASGKLDEDGKYELTTYSPGDGAVVGNHKVYFSISSDNSHLANFSDADYAAGKVPPEPPSSTALPAKYLKQNESGLEREVKTGAAPIDFELK